MQQENPAFGNKTESKCDALRREHLEAFQQNKYFFIYVVFLCTCKNNKERGHVMDRYSMERSESLLRTMSSAEWSNEQWKAAAKVLSPGELYRLCCRVIWAYLMLSCGCHCRSVCIWNHANRVASLEDIINPGPQPPTPGTFLKWQNLSTESSHHFTETKVHSIRFFYFDCYDLYAQFSQ